MNWLQGDMDPANGEAAAARTSDEQKSHEFSNGLW